MVGGFKRAQEVARNFATRDSIFAIDEAQAARAKIEDRRPPRTKAQLKIANPAWRGLLLI
jgi:hypothetical protein